MSTPETEKELVKEFVVAAFERDDRKTVRRMLSSDALVHTPNVPGGDLMSTVRDADSGRLSRRVPGSLDRGRVTDHGGATVICRFTMTGTHEDVFRGIEPSGETIVVTGVVEL